ncbi:diphosphomevalonate decarboxylase [Streptococcus pneumoniae]|nr:diphosphomevalonate decarboxylase [Streptococcus pneumoniae]CIW03744.1 diphosphomevalonate decarboxylase [Streptococcus pneumoniae]
MDAGPNVKVFCQEKDLEHLSEIFGQRYRLIVSKTKDLSQDDCC